MAEPPYQPLPNHQVVTRLTIMFRRDAPIIVSDDGDNIRIENGNGRIAVISRHAALSYRHQLVNHPGQTTATWDIATHYISFVYRNKDTIKRCTGALYPYLMQHEYENAALICHLLSYLYNHKSYYKMLRGTMRHGNLKFIDRCLAHIIMTPDSTGSTVITIKHPWDLYIDGVSVGPLGTSNNQISTSTAYQYALMVIHSETSSGDVDDWSSDSSSAMSDDERFNNMTL